jgi:hypothetical protein
MRTKGHLVVAIALLAGAGATARAETFEEHAAKAVQVRDAAALGALFWAGTVDCKDASDDMQRRQCEGVRDARARAAAGRTYAISGDATSFWAGAWDATKGAVPFALYGCLACQSPVELGGQRRFIVTQGEVSVKGGALTAAEVYKGLRRFPNETAAKKWLTEAVPRLRSQFVFRVPAKAEAFTSGEAKGYQVELIAFRAYDPCDGAMICHSDNVTDQNAAADKAACGGGKASGTDIEGEVKDGGETPPATQPVAPVEKELPDTLTMFQIKQGMAKPTTEINGCFATYGVPGRSDVTVELAGDGTVKSVEVAGDFSDTPTGECIIKAIKKAEFAKFKRATMSFPYPIILR